MREIAGQLRLDGDRLAVRIERRYTATADEIWDVISSAERISRWFAPVSGDLQVGGEFVVMFGEGDDDRSHGRVLQCQPPRRLEITWSFGAGPDDSMLAVDVRPDGDGTVLIIDHRAIPADQIGYGAGWEAYADRLAALLTDEPLPDWWSILSELLPSYTAAAADLRVGRVDGV